MKKQYKIYANGREYGPFESKDQSRTSNIAAENEATAYIKEHHLATRAMDGGLVCLIEIYTPGPENDGKGQSMFYSDRIRQEARK